MKLNIRFPNLKKKINYKQYFKKIGLNDLVKESLIKRKILLNELPENLSFTLPPDLKKLYFLNEFIIRNKRINILEFGSGSSTVVFSYSLNQNKLKYSQAVKSKIRRVSPFKMISVETYKKFADITKKKIIKILGKQINNFSFFITNVVMTTFRDRICTEYSKLPLFSPDFIYLDGPDQRNVSKKINNISTNYNDFFPMSCDILKIEYFLTPGTILIVDGRGANAEFLKRNFMRNWIYKYVKDVDQHVFKLNEKPLGIFNLNQINFYGGN